MSLMDTFDPEGEEIVRPQDAVKPVEGFPQVLISVFSPGTERVFRETVEVEEEIPNAWGPIRVFSCRGKHLGFYRSPIGGPGAVAMLEEVWASGGEKVLYFGSCGALDGGLKAGSLLLPTSAWRDEGVSWHYAPPSDFIEVPTARRLGEILDGLGVSHQPVRTWTTDAMYRETRRNLDLRRRAGCSVVEMECASLMAAARFRGREVYQFLYAADRLDGIAWDPRILGAPLPDLRASLLHLAMEIAFSLA